MAAGLHLPAGIAAMHLRQAAARIGRASQGDHPARGGDRRQSARTQCQASLLPGSSCGLRDATSCWPGRRYFSPQWRRSCCAMAPRFRRASTSTISRSASAHSKAFAPISRRTSRGWRARIRCVAKVAALGLRAATDSELQQPLGSGPALNGQARRAHHLPRGAAGPRRRAASWRAASSLQVVQHDVWQKKLKQEREADDSRSRRAAGRSTTATANCSPRARSSTTSRIALNEVRDTAALRGERSSARSTFRTRGSRTSSGTTIRTSMGRSAPSRCGSWVPLHGVYLKVLYQRVYPMQSVADRILGRLDEDGAEGIEGIEKSLDTLLRGRPGMEHYVLDAKGTRLAAPGPPLLEPVAGHDVVSHHRQWPARRGRRRLARCCRSRPVRAAAIW